jgi:hypothetical protein
LKRPSDPLLRWMRERMQERKLSTAALAMSAGLPASRVRHVLSGQEPMTIDELLLFGKALDISPADFGALPDGLEVTEEDTADAPRAAKPTTRPFLREMETIEEDFEDELDDAFDNADDEDDDEDELSPAAAVDPFGNHPRQLIEIAFGLGCDFLFLARASDLADSGVPEAVLRRYDNREIPIKLDAAYHQYNKPIYTDETLTLTLSFDALYECTFPWASIRQVIFFPVPPEAPAKKPEPPPENVGPKKPFLRLVE